MACEMGNLYNKEAVINALLNKTLNAKFAHIRGLKDLKTLKLTPNPNYSVQNEHDGALPIQFICPITGMEFNGIQPFVVIWTTGFVLSHKAIKEMGVAQLQDEYGPFTPEDVIMLLPDDEMQINLQRQQLIERRNKRKSEKKLKKTPDSDKIVAATVLHPVITSSNNTTEVVNTVESASSHAVKTIGKKRSNPIPESKANAKQPAIAKGSIKPSYTFENSLVKDAQKVIDAQKSDSTVFKDLFHEGGQKVDANTLFATIGGLRYTLH